MQSTSLPRYKLHISYDGTHYSGWQIQPNALSIQECIERAFATLLREKIKIVGAGRTDAGVHAIGQVAHFSTASPIDIRRLQAGLNGLLPHDIRIQGIFPVDPDFHACYDAIRKEYHYHLWLDKTHSPFVRLYRYHPPFPVSIPLLQEACQLFVGTHDFSTFANKGGGAKTSVRNLYRIDLILQEGGCRLEFEGDGFLYKMVRNIVGTLLEVASLKRPIDSIPLLLQAKDRKAAGIAAPPHGLFLMHVQYPASLQKKGQE